MRGAAMCSVMSPCHNLCACHVVISSVDSVWWTQSYVLNMVACRRSIDEGLISIPSCTLWSKVKLLPTQWTESSCDKGCNDVNQTRRINCSCCDLLVPRLKTAEALKSLGWELSQSTGYLPSSMRCNDWSMQLTLNVRLLWSRCKVVNKHCQLNSWNLKWMSFRAKSKM